MKRSAYTFALVPLLLFGCFGSHGGGGAADAGTRDSRVSEDTSARWTTCLDALDAGAPGDSCSFDGSCSRDGDCGGDATARCVRGRLEHESGPTECGRYWSSCEAFLAERGTLGELCDPTAFGDCVQADGPCCQVHTSCSGGFVDQVTSCDDGCPGDPFCEDYPVPPPAVEFCRRDTECDGDAYCLPPPFEGSCGPCFVPEVTCVDNGDCADGDVCTDSPRHPCACGGPTKECVPDCTLRDGACSAGEVCHPDGSCGPQQCTDGYDCGSNSDCVFGGAPADDHGCARHACMVDADCECGACVGGACHSGPGICALPAA